jgi:hypothetical protein
VGDGAEDDIQWGIEMFSEIFGEEAQDMATVFLKQCVFETVAAVGGGINCTSFAMHGRSAVPPCCLRGRDFENRGSFL